MEVPHDLAQRVPPSGLLGYLNFSDGRPDARFQRGLNEACAILMEAGDSAPWETIRDWLLRESDVLQASGSAAFRDLSQARSVITLAFDRVLRAYREHHAYLLAHQPDAAIFTPFFLARVCEAVLQQAGPWDETARIVTGAVLRLNDYVGHRPVAVLETRPQTELYPHERIQPVPLWIRGVGACQGPFRQVVEQAIEILRETDADLRGEAYFDLDLLDELAFDPRGFDHSHPANRRPNYLFGEWDPHLIDNQGRYRRFVVRQVVLDALLSAEGGMRSAELPTPASSEQSAARAGHGLDSAFPTAHSALEAAAVLAGTILMASGVSGEGPTTHDSDTRLGTLVPRIARYRDAFYARLLERLRGADGERLRDEAKRLRQPFGGIRQHLNQELARQRAAQLQDRHLALVYAELGYPAASRARASGIPTASVRILTEVRLRQTAAELSIRRGKRAEAAAHLPEIEDLFERGIACGALADPWNILGFQGLYPLFQSREDSVRDPRNDDLIETLSRQFDLYARVLASAASAGDEPLRKQLDRGVRRLAGWWDRFAAYEVSDVPRLRGAERADAALHVAQALARWAERRTTTIEDLAFWRSQREGFTSPAAFAQVIEALLREGDWRAAKGLLMTWLSEAESVPLAEGEASFHVLAARWVDGVLATTAGPERSNLLARFFGRLEASADVLWSVPHLPGEVRSPEEEDEDRFASAYEDVTYRDSTDDGEEGSVIGDGAGEFPLEEQARRIEERLEFIKTITRVWLAAARPEVWDNAGLVAPWARTARTWRDELLELLDRENDITIPAPAGGQEDVIEFEKRRHIKDGLIDATLSACVEAGRAARALAALLDPDAVEEDANDLDWEPVAVALERAVRQRDAAAVREQLPQLAERLAREPLLFVPTSEGGPPRPIARAKSALALLSELFGSLPRLGLIRETYHLVKLARSMEQNGPPEGRKVSEFDQLFRAALRAVVGALLVAAERSDREKPAPPEHAPKDTKPLPPATLFTSVLREIANSFLKLWIAHSNTLRLSALEAVGTPDDWEELRRFTRTYGRGLFTASFMTYANLRGILHRGVGAWLDGLADSDATGRPEKMLADLESGKLRRERAIFLLEVILHSITEHYEEYKDYNTTTTQSDYGENLHVLLDFLKLKGNHDRFAWRMQPLVLAHEVLCRKGYGDLAQHWRKSIGDSSKDLTERLQNDLAALEAQHAMRLRTVRDRVEGGFALPLRVDRLCSLAGPAARAAREGLDESAEPFRLLEEQIRPFTENPSGVGLDAPSWLRRLEKEVSRLRESDSISSPETESEAGGLTLIELQRQLAEWENPLTGE